MWKSFILVGSLFSFEPWSSRAIAYGPPAANLEIEAYISVLADQNFLNDTALISFEKSLENGQLLNPFDCEKRYCDATEKMHYRNFEEHLANDIDVSHLNDWFREFLMKRKCKTVDRNQTHEDTILPFDNQYSLLAVGSEHVCAINTARKVICFGGNSYHQRDVPEDLEDVISISASFSHTCALERKGRMKCWGLNTFNETEVPKDLGPVIQIAAFAHLSCAILKANNSLKCWGMLKDFQYSVPTDLGTVFEIFSGYYHLWIVKRDGSLRCMSRKGVNACIINDMPTNIGQFPLMSTSFETSCALEIDRSFQCWGTHLTPRTLRKKKHEGTIVQILALSDDTCFLYETGKIRCWGHGKPKSDSFKNGGPYVFLAGKHDTLCGVNVKGEVHCSDSTEEDIPQYLRVPVEDALLKKFHFE